VLVYSYDEAKDALTAYEPGQKAREKQRRRQVNKYALRNSWAGTVTRNGIRIEIGFGIRFGI